MLQDSGLLFTLNLVHRYLSTEMCWLRMECVKCYSWNTLRAGFRLNVYVISSGSQFQSLVVLVKESQVGSMRKTPASVWKPLPITGDSTDLGGLMDKAVSYAYLWTLKQKLAECFSGNCFQLLLEKKDWNCIHAFHNWHKSICSLSSSVCDINEKNYTQKYPWENHQKRVLQAYLAANVIAEYQKIIQ